MKERRMSWVYIGREIGEMVPLNVARVIVLRFFLCKHSRAITTTTDPQLDFQELQLTKLNPHRLIHLKIERNIVGLLHLLLNSIHQASHPTWTFQIWKPYVRNRPISIPTTHHWRKVNSPSSLLGLTKKSEQTKLSFGAPCIETKADQCLHPTSEPHHHSR